VNFGIAEENQPFFRDRIITDHGEDVFHIDTSELCIRQTVHRAIRFKETFSLNDIIEGLGEDRLLCKSLSAAAIRGVPSKQFTLFYRLGGYSGLVS